jgi:hypothetical protein
MYVTNTFFDFFLYGLVENFRYKDFGNGLFEKKISHYKFSQKRINYANELKFLWLRHFFMAKKIQNILFFEKKAKKFLFRKTGLPEKPEYPENRAKKI